MDNHSQEGVFKAFGALRVHCTLVCTLFCIDLMKNFEFCGAGCCRARTGIQCPRPLFTERSTTAGQIATG